MATRFADKELLKKLNAEAARLGYNRQILPEAIDSLDAETILAVSPILLHEHAQGVPVDPHLRCSVRIVHPRSSLFDGLFLDVPIPMFELLPDAEKLAPATA